DGAAALGNICCHDFNPKKRGPDQRVPVILRAISDRLPYLQFRYSNPSARTITLCSSPSCSRINCVPIGGSMVERVCGIILSFFWRVFICSFVSTGRPP